MDCTNIDSLIGNTNTDWAHADAYSSPAPIIIAAHARVRDACAITQPRAKQTFECCLHENMTDVALAMINNKSNIYSNSRVLAVITVIITVK